MKKISLKAARTNKGLTQKEAAKKAGISEATIIRWEKGRTAPDVRQLKRLCSVYDLTIDDIFLNEEYA